MSGGAPQWEKCPTRFDAAEARQFHIESEAHPTPSSPRICRGKSYAYTSKHYAYTCKHVGWILEVLIGMNRRGPDPRITWIVDFMQRRLSEPLSAAHLAELVNLSRSQFAALFVAQTGMAPMRFLQRLRLRRARVLLERTFLSVKEIMALAGYNDPSHFTRDFRREYGTPPSEMRDSSLATPLSQGDSTSVDSP
jgi:AraC-like DNA-binding protein